MRSYCITSKYPSSGLQTLKKMYQLPYSSNLNAEVVFFFLNLIDFKLHTESMQLQLHEKKNFIQYITE